MKFLVNCPFFYTLTVFWSQLLNTWFAVIERFGGPGLTDLSMLASRHVRNGS